MPNVDPAIIEALGLDATKTKIITHGSSGFSSTFKIVTNLDGREKNYFVKTGVGKDAEVMFRGEHTSLNAIANAVPSFCPRSHAHGSLSSDPNRFFLATDFLDLHNSSSSGSKGTPTLAQKLAKLHTTPAPIPEGFDQPMFGFPVPTCCGSTVQDNSWKASWADFYAENRVCHILRECETANGQDANLKALGSKIVDRVIPRLLGQQTLKNVVPVTIHGDLWSGNQSVGVLAGEGVAQPVVFDPSCCYGHSEYELGIMRMFGGFGAGFWKEYEKLVPKSEPVEEWEDRLQLYELYHHLNHYALFGGGYKQGAVSIMNNLIGKYGK